jgi:hypothetical protein
MKLFVVTMMGVIALSVPGERAFGQERETPSNPQPPPSSNPQPPESSIPQPPERSTPRGGGWRLVDSQPYYSHKDGSQIGYEETWTNDATGETRNGVMNYSGAPGSAGPSGSDVGYLVQQQGSQLQQAQKALVQAGNQLNSDIDKFTGQRNGAKDQMQRAQSDQQKETQQARNDVQSRYGRQNYNLCDDPSNPYDSCTHEDRKAYWDRQLQEKLAEVERRGTSADSKLTQSKDRYDQANQQLQRLESKSQEFNQRANQLKSLAQGHNSGDLWSAVDQLKHNWVDVKPLYDGNWLSR